MGEEEEEEDEVEEEEAEADGRGDGAFSGAGLDELAADLQELLPDDIADLS